jgi:hypothetical protein
MELYPIYDENVSISSNIWYSISGIGESPFMRVGHSCIHVGSENDKGKLYIVGGANPSGSFNDIYVFDLNTLSWDKWEDLPNFESGRYEHSCWLHRSGETSSIYIFGGANQTESLNDVLKFDLVEKKMEKAESQGWTIKPCARTLHNSCTYKNQLIVFGGGLNGKTPVDDPNTYIYNASSNKWIVIRPNNEGLFLVLVLVYIVQSLLLYVDVLMLVLSIKLQTEPL